MSFLQRALLLYNSIIVWVIDPAQRLDTKRGK